MSNALNSFTATMRKQYQRIMVAGCSGAGKSTLSKQLAERMDLPLIHLDQQYWNPGWVETKESEWRAKVAAIAAEDRWLMDGNYSGTWDLRLPRVELVIYLQYSLPVLLYRALKRTFTLHGTTRQDMAPGCPERFDLEFLHFVIACPLHHRKKHLRLLADLREDQELLVFHSPRALAAWLRE